MKSHSPALLKLLREGVAIKALPKLFVEWEHNRFSPIASISVTPNQDAATSEWNSIYDLAAIGEPNRPGSGAAKARFSPGLKISLGYGDKPTNRFYLSGQEDQY